jgi:hypothetical protein
MRAHGRHRPVAGGGGHDLGHAPERGAGQGLGHRVPLAPAVELAAQVVEEVEAGRGAAGERKAGEGVHGVRPDREAARIAQKG